ncbi:MAG: DUF4880 domain-containing protein [Nitrospira sp. CR1.2]|nr:DUF4880 domain-containing protein [Nitrospira sp. CR1.2]
MTMANELEEQTASADEAARWVVRMDAGPLPAEEQREFESWKASSPSHERVFQEVAALWSTCDRLPEHSGPQTVPAPGRWTRQATTYVPTRWAVGVAAALCACSVLWMTGGLPLLDADYSTPTAEQRRVTLSDGSFVHLNTNSAIAVAMTPARREVRLLKGEAMFAVSPDSARPFHVVAGDLVSTALGTEFIVRRREDQVTVTVLDHRVRVTTTQRDLLLEPGQQVAYAPRQGMSAVRHADLRAAAAWQRGKIIFEGQPLGEVIDELNRYHRGQIFLVDSHLRALRVNGVFQIDNPVQVVDALEQSLHIRSTRFSRYLILLHR